MNKLLVQRNRDASHCQTLSLVEHNIATQQMFGKHSLAAGKQIGRRVPLQS